MTEIEISFGTLPVESADASTASVEDATVRNHQILVALFDCAETCALLFVLCPLSFVVSPQPSPGDILNLLAELDDLLRGPTSKHLSTNLNQQQQSHQQALGLHSVNFLDPSAWRFIADVSPNATELNGLPPQRGCEEITHLR
jgi:hypothetical protein